MTPLREPPTTGNTVSAPALLFALWLYLIYIGGGISPAAWGSAAVVLVLGAVALGATGHLPLGLDGLSLAVLALFGLYALWVWLTIFWSQAPGLTVEEAARTTFYLAYFAVALLAFRRRGASAGEVLPHLLVATAGVLIALAVVRLVTLGFENGTGPTFRFAFPIAYANHAAAIYLLCFWPLLGVAQERSLPLYLRASALGLTAPLVQFTLLSQSRGALLSLAVITPLAFVLVPHRLRALAYLAVPGLLVGLTLLPLNAYWSGGTRTITPLLPAGYFIFAFLAAAGATLVIARLELRLSLSPRTRRLFGAVALVGAIAFVVAVLALAGQGLDLPGDASAGRLLQGSDTGRTAIWEAALQEFEREPWLGVGAGTFGESWDRLNGGNLEPEQPHNLVLKGLAETGVVGASLLFGALSLATFAIVRARWPGASRGAPRAFRQGEPARGVPPAVYLLLSVAYFLVHAQIEALWFMPAVALPALLLLAAGMTRTP